MGSAARQDGHLVEGLCAECIHRKEIRNDRGSIFIMCLRSFNEPEYPKYPRLPVLSCAGFEKVSSDLGNAGIAQLA
jgi:hypothetical protein